MLLDNNDVLYGLFFQPILLTNNYPLIDRKDEEEKQENKIRISEQRWRI